MLGILILATISIVVVCSIYNYNLKPPKNSKDVIEIEIPNGSSVKKVASILKSNNLIRSEKIFIIYTKIMNKSNLKSGIYKVTAYCACMQCCGKTNGITASGTHATANRTIATPSTFPFGTKVLINGITDTVEDRGGAIQGNRIDIYMDSHAEALRFGVQYLYVEVLD